MAENGFIDTKLDIYWHSLRLSEQSELRRNHSNDLKTIFTEKSNGRRDEKIQPQTVGKESRNANKQKKTFFFENVSNFKAF